MAVGLVHALAWCLVVAPLTGPDENNHAAYVQHVAETGDSPQATRGHRTYSSQMDELLTRAQLQSMINNYGARPSLDGWSEISRRLDTAPRSARDNGDGPNPVAFNPPLYYHLAALVYRLSPDTSLTSRLFLIRATTALLMPVMVLLAWLIAAEIFAAAWARTLTATLVALQPKLGFMAGTVNPDMLMITLFTATLLLGLRVAKGSLTTRNLVLMGLFTGCAVLTHGRGFAAVPVALLATAIGLERARPPLREALRKLAALAGPVVACAIVAVLYTRGHDAGGGAFGGEVGRAAASFNVKQLLSFIWQFYLPGLDFMSARPGAGIGYRQVFIVGFFGEQGGLDINFARSTYGYIQLFCGVGLVMFFVCAIRRFERLLARWREVLVLAGALVSLMFLLHYSEYRDVLQGSDGLLTGRYILPLVTLYGLAVTFVASSLPRKLRPILVGLAASSALVIALGALGNAVERLNA